METLSEHIVAVVGVLAVTFTALLGCIAFIVNGFRQEMREDREARREMMKGFEAKIEKIESFLEKVSGELFNRVRDTEKSIERLWGEHRGQHSRGREE